MPASRQGVSIFSIFSASSANPISGTFRESNDIGAATFRSFAITGTFFLAAHIGSHQGLWISNFCQVLGNTLTTLSNDHFDASTFEATYNPRTQTITISNNQNTNFQLHLPSNLPFAKNVLGMGAGLNSTSSAGTITSSVAPFYQWKSQYSERQKFSRKYEPTPFFYDHEASDGTCYSYGRLSSSQYCDWSFENEPIRKVYSNKATAAEAYSYQRLIEDSRSDKPVLVFSGGVNTDKTDLSDYAEGLYRYRAESSNFKPYFRDINNHTFVSVDCKMRVLSGGV